MSEVIRVDFSKNQDQQEIGSPDEVVSIEEHKDNKGLVLEIKLGKKGNTERNKPNLDDGNNEPGPDAA
jgi:hypothetical protein